MRTSTGSESTRLIVIRGNSASGKSTLAAAVRERLGGATALVEQDYFRWQLLQGTTKERRAGDAIAMIDSVVRQSLDAGYDTILEGILNLRDYAAPLERLAQDHAGPTVFAQFDLSLSETQRRHLGRPHKASLFSTDDLADWYDGWQPLPFAREIRIKANRAMEDVAHEVLGRLDTPSLAE